MNKIMESKALWYTGGFSLGAGAIFFATFAGGHYWWALAGGIVSTTAGVAMLAAKTTDVACKCIEKKKEEEKSKPRLVFIEDGAPEGNRSIGNDQL